MQYSCRIYNRKGFVYGRFVKRRQVPQQADIDLTWVRWASCTDRNKCKTVKTRSTWQQQQNEK